MPIKTHLKPLRRSWRKGRRRLADWGNYWRWRCAAKEADSVYFYTLHKCASSLFSEFVLKHCNGMRHVDHLQPLYAGEAFRGLQIQAKAHVYGPLRLSNDVVQPYFETFIGELFSADFVRDKQALFLVRDPRDILVSMYYSFGFSHGFSRVPAIRALQERQRAAIESKTLDQYVLATASEMLANFHQTSELRQAAACSVLLRYEDMIDDWPRFAADLQRFLRFSPHTLQQIHARSRPQDHERLDSHRRSGRTGGFRSKLQPQTLTELDRLLGPVLTEYGYPLAHPEVNRG